MTSKDAKYRELIKTLEKVQIRSMPEAAGIEALRLIVESHEARIQEQHRELDELRRLVRRVLDPKGEDLCPTTPTPWGG